MGKTNETTTKAKSPIIAPATTPNYPGLLVVPVRADMEAPSSMKPTALPAANEPMLSADVRSLADAVADIVLARVRETLEACASRGTNSAPTPCSPTDEWLTAEDAARYLGMNKKALYTAVERGQVPASRLGRRLRFNRAGLAHLLLRSRVRGAGMASRVPSPGKDS